MRRIEIQYVTMATVSGRRALFAVCGDGVAFEIQPEDVKIVDGRMFVLA